MDQMDVVTAFLQSELIEEIFMRFPEGFVNDGNKVCKLKKLYGLKHGISGIQSGYMNLVSYTR